VLSSWLNNKISERFFGSMIKFREREILGKRKAPKQGCVSWILL
jgi:hypothetical protein